MRSPQLEHALSIPAQLAWGVVTESWAALRGQASPPDAPDDLSSWEIVGEALLDRLFKLSTHVMTGVPEPEVIQGALRDATIARDLYDALGFFQDPASYHGVPDGGPFSSLEESYAWEGTLRRKYGHLRFDSGYTPHSGEPGRQKWMDHPTNSTAHAYVLEHAGAPRPWLIGIHGFGMGPPWINFSGFRAQHLHDDLGLNLVLPCLPLHGTRGSSAFGGRELLAPDYVRLVLWFAHAVWDVRRVIRWIRERSDAPIGLYGVSLGSCVAALVASLEDGLDCVITGLPVVDFPSLARDNEPWVYRRHSESLGADWDLIRDITRVVSPLELTPRVPHAGRFIYAGLGDRVVSSDQALALWRHWDKPSIRWLAGGHVLGGWRGAPDFMEESLRQVNFIQ